MKKFIIIFLIIFFSGAVFDIARGEATSSFGKSESEMGNFAKNLKFVDFDTSTASVIENIMLLVNTLFFIFMIYGGILWLTSSGSEEKITKAKSIVIYCIIGMVVTVSAYAITMFVINRVG